jgi:ribonuclease III
VSGIKMYDKSTCNLALQKIVGHDLLDPSLLELAVTHKSAVRGVSSPGLNNERLEFLGDAVLSLVTANYLFCNYTSFREGELSKMRALFVCRENLSKAAMEVGLGQYIASDKSMHASGSTNCKSILADALEAIIGAVFIDRGYEAAERAVFRLLGYPIENLNRDQIDAKTKLQEIIQASFHKPPKYIVLASDGPDHAPIFTMGVLVNGEILATAQGGNKKTAAQNAAGLLLEKLSSATIP